MRGPRFARFGSLVVAVVLLTPAVSSAQSAITGLVTDATGAVLPGVTVDAGYAHLFVKNSSIRETSPTGDVLTGRFRNRVDIISLGTRTVF